VIDASFRSAATRAAARALAARQGVPFTMVECVAPRDLLLERLAKREARGTHESDARTDLLDEFEARFEPIDELPQSEHVRLDTSAPAEENRRRLEALLET
jgi:predicted kinase